MTLTAASWLSQASDVLGKRMQGWLNGQQRPIDLLKNDGAGQVTGVQTSAGLRRKREMFVVRRSFVAVCCCQLPQCRHHQFPLKSPFNYQILVLSSQGPLHDAPPAGCVQAMPRIPFFWASFNAVRCNSDSHAMIFAAL